MTNSDKTEIQDDDDREGSRKLSLEGNAPPLEIDGYTFVRRLGTGAYGTVWLAREDRTGRTVAVKYYPHRRGLNWSLLNREVEKLATLYASRNIVRLLDVGWNAEPPYYVMEFVENGSLGEYLTGGALSVQETVRIARQVCGALIEAHGAGVLHCDLKPDNVLLDAQFQVRLCDFGQSRMSHEQSPALGTLYYMAPEQANLEAVPDARWDVYAVGALIYHMLTGQPPYRCPEIQKKLEQAGSLQDRLTVYQQYIQDVPPPTDHHSVRGVDRALAGVVDQCLCVDPQLRLPNAQAVLNQLLVRDKNRSRRPLLLVGVVGPVLLMCAMVPIFVRAMQKNIREGEARIVEGVQRSNGLVALSQANALQRELEDRLTEMQEVTGQIPAASGTYDTEMARILTEIMQRPPDEAVAETEQFHDVPFAERPEWIQRLDHAHEIADERNRTAGRSTDISWFFTDITGLTVWRRPYSARTVGRNFRHRDYFHGNNVEYAPETIPEDIQPIQEPHVSLPFVSTTTRRYMVALSVPVRSANGAIIGVFARTLHLGDLQQQLGQDLRGKSDSTSRLIALADRRDAQLLDHPWLQEEIFTDKEQARKIFQKLRLPDSTMTHIDQELEQAGSEYGGVRETDYEDPVGLLEVSSATRYAVPWIASILPMKSDKMPWLVIVQEKRAVVVDPVRDMEQRMNRQAVYAVLASIGTMAAIWLFVWYAVVRAQDRDRRPRIASARS